MIRLETTAGAMVFEPPNVTESQQEQRGIQVRLYVVVSGAIGAAVQCSREALSSDCRACRQEPRSRMAEGRTHNNNNTSLHNSCLFQRFHGVEARLK